MVQNLLNNYDYGNNYGSSLTTASGALDPTFEKRLPNWQANSPAPPSSVSASPLAPSPPGPVPGTSKAPSKGAFLLEKLFRWIVREPVGRSFEEPPTVSEVHSAQGRFPPPK